MRKLKQNTGGVPLSYSVRALLIASQDLSKRYLDFRYRGLLPDFDPAMHNKISEQGLLNNI
jgi:hypothetical protein